MNYLRKAKTLLSKNIWLSSIIVLSFFVCIGYSFSFKIEPKVDARAYDKIAWNIAEGNGYREEAKIDIKQDNALLRVGPIYEYFLAGIYKLFGHYYGPVWVIQALLHAMSAFFIYLISLAIFEDHEGRAKIGLIAAVVFAFYPDLVEISAMLMTETLYLFFVCLALYLFFRYLKQPTLHSLWRLSVIAGLAVLARPPLLFCLPIILYHFLKTKHYKHALIFISILILVFTPWTVRNHMVYQKMMPFGSAGQLNFWIGNYPGGNGEQESPKEANDFILNNEVWTVGDESVRQFKNFVVEHPGEFSLLSLKRINKYFSIFRPMGFWFYDSGWSQIIFVASSAAVSFFVLILALAGMILIIKSKNKPVALNYLALFTVATPIILFVTVVETRYRFQIYPFLAILAAYFIVEYKKDKNLWLKILVVASLVVIVNGGLDLAVNLESFKAKLASHLS